MFSPRHTIIGSIIRNLSQSTVATLSNIIHLVFKGEWISKASAQKEISKNIVSLAKDLLAKKFTSAEEFEQSKADRTWIQQSIHELRATCNILEKKGVPEKKIAPLLESLHHLDQVNTEEGQKEEALFTSFGHLAAIGDPFEATTKVKPDKKVKAAGLLNERIKTFITEAYAYKAKGFGGLQASLGRVRGAKSEDNIKLNKLKNLDYTKLSS